MWALPCGHFVRFPRPASCPTCALKALHHDTREAYLRPWKALYERLIAYQALVEDLAAARNRLALAEGCRSVPDRRKRPIGEPCYFVDSELVFSDDDGALDGEGRDKLDHDEEEMLSARDVFGFNSLFEYQEGKRRESARRRAECRGCYACKCGAWRRVEKVRALEWEVRAADRQLKDFIVEELRSSAEPVY